MALNNKHLLSHSYGGYKTEIQDWPCAELTLWSLRDHSQRRARLEYPDGHPYDSGSSQTLSTTLIKDKTKPIPCFLGP